MINHYCNFVFMSEKSIQKYLHPLQIQCSRNFNIINSMLGRQKISHYESNLPPRAVTSNFMFTTFILCRTIKCHQRFLHQKIGSFYSMYTRPSSDPMNFKIHKKQVTAISLRQIFLIFSSSTHMQMHTTCFSLDVRYMLPLFIGRS